jgi:hypothetical protein
MSSMNKYKDGEDKKMKTWLRFWTNTQLELLLGRYSLE